MSNMNKSKFLQLFLLLASSAILLASREASANTKVFAEGVVYSNGTCAMGPPPASPICGGTWAPLCNTSQNASDFYTRMTAPGTVWTAGHFYHDSAVWDSDFVDPDATTLAYGGDTANFDRSDTALSFFSGHGSCADYTSAAGKKPFNCVNDAACTTPGAGQTMPSRCLWDPFDGKGSCFYSAPHLIGTCSNSQQFGNAPVATGGLMKFGESTNSGGWAGAGTNGGINVAILDNSNAIRSPWFIWQSAAPMFAGMSLLGLIMPIGWGADAGDYGQVGPTFAIRMVANPSASITDNWLGALSDIPPGDGSSCGNSTIGGGHGIVGPAGSGCGGHIMVSIGATCSSATSTVTYMSSFGAQNDYNDMTGAACQSNFYACNYDCVTYPFDKG